VYACTLRIARERIDEWLAIEGVAGNCQIEVGGRHGGPWSLWCQHSFPLFDCAMRDGTRRLVTVRRADC
jgi:hypothetical protein